MALLGVVALELVLTTSSMEALQGRLRLGIRLGPVLGMLVLVLNIQSWHRNDSSAIHEETPFAANNVDFFVQDSFSRGHVHPGLDADRQLKYRRSRLGQLVLHLVRRGVRSKTRSSLVPAMANVSVNRRLEERVLDSTAARPVSPTARVLKSNQHGRTQVPDRLKVRPLKCLCLLVSNGRRDVHIAGVA
ncbi:MAG: hypothetical protein JOS17DRAFT_344594 [Linnemannia elongata]|nr:MAG: hypothetical protein JOS17DRAFT_344594 [Linnemannia elongata]